MRWGYANFETYVFDVWWLCLWRPHASWCHLCWCDTSSPFKLRYWTITKSNLFFYSKKFWQTPFCLEHDFKFDRVSQGLTNLIQYFTHPKHNLDDAFNISTWIQVWYIEGPNKIFMLILCRHSILDIGHG